MKIVYTDRFYEHFCFWKKNNKKVAAKIEELILAIQGNPFEGIGKPEALLYELSKCWSRRINYEHRLIYKIDQEVIILLTCRFRCDR